MRSSGIAGGRFAIASSGFAEGPAQALEMFLLEKGASTVTTMLHPLLMEGDVAHRVRQFEDGILIKDRSIRLPFRPPLTYPVDLLVPLRSPRADAWFGFNNLACLRGLLGRRRGRVGKVVYWCVDFVPDRFGTSVVTGAYDVLDSYVARRVDARFELSEAAVEGRNARLGTAKGPLSPTKVVPMGAWLDKVPTTPPDAHRRRRVVYMGHLVPRQGVDTLVRAIGLLRSQGVSLHADIVGRGPEEENLKALADQLDVQDILFHGFVEDHREVERILAGCSIAAAPYVADSTSFTRFADPGKLKAYLAAGLPIVLTDVPPNARELATSGAAVLVEDSAEAVASALKELLDHPDLWATRREAALQVAKSFDYNNIFEEALGFIGFES